VLVNLGSEGWIRQVRPMAVVKVGSSRKLLLIDVGDKVFPIAAERKGIGWHCIKIVPEPHAGSRREDNIEHPAAAHIDNDIADLTNGLVVYVLNTHSNQLI